MAKSVIPLTVTQIKNAKAKEKEYTLSDGAGLQLRVNFNGSKLWVLKYSDPITKKRTNLSLGNFPEVSLAEARRQRLEAKTLIAKGINPKVHRDTLREKHIKQQAYTFGQQAEKWYELKKETVKADTAYKSYQSLQKHIIPTFGNSPIQDITPRQMISVLEPIKAKGSYETVKRLCRIINEIMRQAVASGVIEFNYLADLTKLFPAPNRQHMPTIKPAQLPELMSNIREANILKTTRNLLKWQLHTMTRPIEAASTKL